MATATELIEEIKKMSVLELSELIKALEEEFGVSATAVAAATCTVADKGAVAQCHGGGGAIYCAAVLANRVPVERAIRQRWRGRLVADSAAAGGGIVSDETAADEHRR